MNKLSKEKRDKVILVCLLCVGIAGVLYTFILSAQKERLGLYNRQIVTARDKVGKAERLIHNAQIIEANLRDSQKALESRYETMAPQGQYYYWFLKLVDQFRQDEKLDASFIMDISQPEFADAGLLPQFQYKAAIFGLRLNGQFQDIGRFIADLENSFPYFRVQSLKVAPRRGGTFSPGQSNLTQLANETEDKLVVELRLITLIRGGTT